MKRFHIYFHPTESDYYPAELYLGNVVAEHYVLIGNHYIFMANGEAVACFASVRVEEAK